MASSSWRHPGDVHLEQRGALGRAELEPGDVEDAAHRNAADRGGSRGVAGTRARPEAGGPLGRIDANQGPLVDEQLGEPIAPLVAAVAPQDPLGGGGGGEALDESKQALVRGRWRGHRFLSGCGPECGADEASDRSLGIALTSRRCSTQRRGPGARAGRRPASGTPQRGQRPQVSASARSTLDQQKPQTRVSTPSGRSVISASTGQVG